MKKTVVFDFDGVIHSYKSGWKGETVIPDEPVQGIEDALKEIHKSGYRIVVMSTRCRTHEGCWAVNDWLLNHDLLKYVDLITSDKPPAVAYIDDRAICFDGDCSKLLSKINNFTPWYKK